MQGNLELLWWLEQTLKEIFGLPRVTLQPVAGAHGELAGILMVHKALAKSGNARKYILIPDSAHGTNPASAAFAGYQIKELKSNSRGTVDLDVLAEAVTEDVAALMITVPNTLGRVRVRDQADGGHPSREGRLSLLRRREPQLASSASPARATWASTSSTPTCTRPSRRRTAAAVRAPVRWA